MKRFITWSWAPEQVFADDVPVITHPSISGGQPLISQKSAAKLRIFYETTKQKFIILIFYKF